jgi:hypothetical protein
MFPFVNAAVDDGDAVRFRVGADATTETSRHAPQMGVVETSSDPVRRRHQTRNPPALCPWRKYAFSTMRSTQS